MDFFHKGSNPPPPLIFGSYGTRKAHLSFGYQKGENITSQNTQNGKMPKGVQNPLF